MRLIKRLLALSLILSAAAWPRSSGPRDVQSPLAALLRHQQNLAQRSRAQAARPEQQPANVLLPDSGNIAVMDESESIVVPAGFDLDQKTVEFKPAGNASRYTFDVAADRFDSASLGQAKQITLGDDEESPVPLPFSFPFFGLRYTSVFIGSDGHMTFGSAEGPDFISTPRDFIRMVTGPPRVAPLFTDLDPSQPNSVISYLSSPTRFLVTWQNVPLYATTPGSGVPRQTFQAALYPDGRIEFSYNGISAGTIDVLPVGIAPGGAVFTCQVAFVDYSVGSTQVYPAAIVEEFANTPRFDDLEIPLKFYKNHQDAYDILVVFDTVTRPDVSACAFNQPIRNWVHGLGIILQSIGASEFNASRSFGSTGGRLQGLVYMGPLDRYPSDPNQISPLAGGCGQNSVMSILGQETGHRFLAYPQFLDPDTGQPSTDLLGRDQQHWSYYFNSDASVMEGNRIVDHGAGMSPRFETTAIVQHYSALDQYMMGLRAPADVPPSFLVRQPSIDFPAAHGPQAGVLFDGTRLDIPLSSITAVEGPRAPDYTLSSKQLHFAFILLVPAGQTPTTTQINKLDAYRTAWQTYFSAATDNNGTAVTGLANQLALSIFPNAGIIQGRTLNATVTLGSPAASDVKVFLSASSPAITVPSSVTVPAGSRTAPFTITGSATGAAALTAQGPDGSYEASQAFIKVRPSLSGLVLERLSAPLVDAALIFPFPESLALSAGAGGNLGEDLLFRVRDDSYIPYPGLQLDASGSGAVTPSNLVTGANGMVRFQWKLNANPGMNTLNVVLDGQPDVSARVHAVGRLQPPRFRDVNELPACPVTGN